MTGTPEHIPVYSRLRALLAVTRLERDGLANRLAEVLDEPPAMVAGQIELPFPK